MSTQQAKALSRSGPIMVVAAMHVGIIYVISMSLGIVPIPRLLPPIKVLDIKELKQRPDDIKPVPDPAIPQLRIDRTLQIPPPVLTIDDDDTPTGITGRVVDVPVDVDPRRIETAPQPQRLHATVRIDPLYPPGERRLGHEGVVQLQVRVDERGHVLDVQVTRSSGFPRLDDSAAEAVRRWRFSPATDGVQATTGLGIVAVTFKLQ